MTIESIALREGMIVIRSVLEGRIGQFNGREQEVAQSIAETLHNFSSTDELLTDMTIDRLTHLFADNPDLSKLLVQTHGWLCEQRQFNERKL